MRLRTVGLLGVLLLQFHTTAFGWGNVGHYSVGIVADKVLTSTTRARIRQILGNDTLAGVSTWADMIRRLDEWKHTAWYHFTKTPDRVSYVDHLRGLSHSDRNKGDVVLAMAKAELVLRDRTASAGDQKAALAFLIHFVGDAHQPFHSGRDEDRGGNLIDVIWMGEATNLHSVWDVKLIHSSYGDFDHADTNQAALEYVGQIDQTTSAERRAWMAGYFDSWLDESTEARIRPYVGYNHNQEVYRRTYIEVVNERILQAGYRLGALLNSIYDPAARDVIANLATSSQAFHTRAREILGTNYMNRIVLRPLSSLKPGEADRLRGMKEFPPPCPH